MLVADETCVHAVTFAVTSRTAENTANVTVQRSRVCCSS